MRNIVIIGSGYVGLVTGACLADMGNHVVGLDCDVEKTEALLRGVMPIYEPRLEETVLRNCGAGRLSFTTSYEESIPHAEIVFIAVGTPSGAIGQADLHYVEEAARSIARHIAQPVTIVNKSTVPIGTGDLVADIVREQGVPAERFSVVSNPEFLREGSAINDFMHPDRVVLGATDPAAAEVVADLYRPLKCPILVTDLRTAEMIKYASNAFLATKISFINEIGAICEQLGADVKAVAAGMGLDKRIGPAFLDAGIGWGGSCFPKDVKALVNMAANGGAHPQLLRAVMEINYDQRRQVVIKLKQALGSLRGRTVGLLGLAFKPDTDDMRDAPSRDIIALLQAEGAKVRVYDPVAMEAARRLLSDVVYCASAYDVAAGCDALAVVTEWNEFKQLDLAAIHRLMRRPIVIDGRNIYDPARMRQLGFIYYGFGRGYNGVETSASVRG
ncbi:MAG: UDP-glucose dehydrogenase family protein [Chloroflexota bacterium]